ncbi:hypothetical protein LSH36_13g03043 [Paralvinella palmiformis]|uniref:General transcription factor 3C polypeptide 3 n=1 Tax=Paralvinella palmiformis TaxID=53620 RepID=A0AAD9KD62_9ANNE|nr:hypothetical protein LSH36_13g03043 [Paralvinella palmiformis]
MEWHVVRRYIEATFTRYGHGPGRLVGVTLKPNTVASHPKVIVDLVTVRITGDNVNVDKSISIGAHRMQEYELFWPEGCYSSLSKKVATLAITNKHIQVDQTTVYDTDLIYTRGEFSLTPAAMDQTPQEENVEVSHVVTLKDVENLNISGVHPRLDMEIIQVKEEPVDPDHPGETTTTAVTLAADEVEEEDDDVIFVDKETTMRYITGEISFEEYSAHLEQQAEIKDETDGMPVIEIAEETVSTVEMPTVGKSSTVGRPGRPKNSSRKSRLPSHLLGLMGEANMRYAQGQTDEAIKMCMEIIRNVPSAYEPFQTLGMIYEERGDDKRAMQYALIAAHLCSDTQEWLRVADMCNEQGDLEKTIHCYNKAIRCDPKNIALWKTYCELSERAGNKKQVMHGHQMILKILPPDSSDQYLELARELIKDFHASGDIDKAVDIMTTAFEVHSKNVTAEGRNMLGLGYTEIHSMSRQSYLGKMVRCDVMDEMSVDLRSKLVVCLVHLAHYGCVNAIADSVLNENPVEVGDLHLDIAEAYIDKGLYKKAKTILAGLVKTKDYNLAAVWLRYGECLNAVGELQSAVRAYKKVVELAPMHLGARVSLASIQQQLGKHEEALEALETARDLLNESSVTLQDLWELYLRLISVLVEQKRFQDFEDVSVLCLIFPPFVNDAKILPELKFLCLTGCMLNTNGEFAYCLIRDMCLNDLENNCLWNLFCQAVTLIKDLRHSRFCIRMMMKYPDHLPLCILNGNNALISGSYKHALGEYVSALKQTPHDPLLNLLVGITYFHLASQKFAARRNSLIIQGCSFLNLYLELRGDCQESNYNLGRAMHQIGLHHTAVYYYERVLSQPPVIDDDDRSSKIFDLSREAAFNLSLIYKASGSEDLAHNIIQKYIVI